MTPSATDASIELLLHKLQHKGTGIWLADEQHSGYMNKLRPFSHHLKVISNRFDIAEEAANQGLSSTFNDWNIRTSEAGSAPIDQIFLRVCKEKAVTHHLIQQAFLALGEGGTLYLTGQKNEGIKGYASRTETYFSHRSRLIKAGDSYCGAYTKQQEYPNGSLDTQAYDQIREIGEYDGQAIYSKPGVYGWDKIDAGSVFLAQQLQIMSDSANLATDSILDIGCGYGLFILATQKLACARRVATDNNAGALICAQYNAKQWNLSAEVLAGDCADTVTGTFDLILCNPPFHKGFGVEGDLIERFLQAAKAHLSRCGVALFVVNSFIPIEKNAAPFFSKCITVANNKQFKVLALHY